MAAGGDGSLGALFQTIGEAIAATPTGGVVAIAAGEYVESPVLARLLELRGRGG